MNKIFSNSNFHTDEETVNIPIRELHDLRNNLESLIRTVDKHLTQHHANKQVIQEPLSSQNVPTKQTPKKQVKAKSLGICMFVNKRIIKDKEIDNIQALEECPDRCKSKAIHLKEGILLCGRHKDSDISKLQQIIQGIKPVIKTIEIEPENVDEGQYEPETTNKNNERTDYDNIVNEVTGLEKLLESDKGVLPCRIGFKDVCIVNFENTNYVITINGCCFGKITDEEKIESIEIKTKRKEYCDITGMIEELSPSDIRFLKLHSMNYSKQYI